MASPSSIQFIRVTSPDPAAPAPTAALPRLIQYSILSILRLAAGACPHCARFAGHGATATMSGPSDRSSCGHYPPMVERGPAAGHGLLGRSCNLGKRSILL